MRKYFIIDGYQRKGPYSPEELIEFKINKDTLIWTFDSGKEIPAGDIAELQHIFSGNIPQQDTPPPPPQADIVNEQEILNKQKEEEYLKLVEEQKKKYEEEVKQKKEEAEKQIESGFIEDENITIEDKEEEATPSDKFEDEKYVSGFVPINENVPPNVQEIDAPEELAETTDLESTNKYEHKEYSSNTFNAATNPNSFKKPPTYLALGIITTILCCLPLGIASIVAATQVEQKFQAGDIEGAEKSSKTALTLGLIAIGGGILGLIFVLISNA